MEDEMTPTGFPACPNCKCPTVTKGQFCCVDCSIEYWKRKTGEEEAFGSDCNGKCEN